MSKVDEWIKEYVETKDVVNKMQKHLDALKAEINNAIKSDLHVIEGVGQFKRKSSFVRKNFDKKKAQEYLTEDQYNDCVNESQVNGSVEIVSWDTLELRKSMMERKGNGI